MRFSIPVCLVLLLIIPQCAKVPLTGRTQLNIVSNSELIPMSFAQYDEVIKQSKLSSDQKQTALVKRVGTKIQRAVETYLRNEGLSKHLQGFEWEYNLIDEDVANAWCMPGGKVAFYTGIMPICLDETGIAVVMGHEVAHAIANHGRERMSQALVAQMGLSTLSEAMSTDPNLTKQILLQSVGIGSQLGMLKFSRTHESEADKMGLIFMAIAGYNPEAAPEFWERMSKMSGGASAPEWLSTHPSHSTRINALKEQLPEAKKYYKGN